MSEDASDNTELQSERGFFGRWSDRKLESNQPPERDLSDPLANTPPGQTEADLATTAQDAALEDAPGDEDMPPIESLTEDSDYSPFLSPRVSAQLQRMAMRKLFGVPSFNLRDGLDDYDDDFTRFAKLGDIITADMRHRIEREAEALAKAESEPAELEKTDKEGVLKESAEEDHDTEHAEAQLASTDQAADDPANSATHPDAQHAALDSDDSSNEETV